MSALAFTRARDLGALPELVAKAAGRGAVSRMFRDQDISPAILDRPDALLLYRDCLGLYMRASQITGERSFGLRVGATYNLDEYGVFGRYVASAPDLKQALTRARGAIQFHENFSRIDLDPEGGDFKFVYRSFERNCVGWRHVADMSLYLMFDLVRRFLGDAWRPKRIEVSYRRGAWETDVEDHFGAPVLFGRPALAIVFSRDLLDTPNVRPRSSGNIVTRADVERSGKSLPQDFLSAAAEIVRQRLLNGRTDLDGTSAKLGLGPRTFQRRLNDKGLSYRRMLSGCLEERAIDLLAEDTVSNAEVAVALGYSSETQFTRAFKQWRGVTPGKFRKSFQQARAAR